MGVKTALEFAKLPEQVVKKRFTKPGREIWRELRGESVYPVEPEEKTDYASISKTKTFAPPSADPEYLFAHLIRNLESACIKARRYGLAPRRVAAFLKRQNFDTTGREARLSRPCAHPLELSPLLRGLFNDLYRRRDLYRATGIVLLDLAPDANVQYSLFEDPLKAEKIRELYDAVDAVSRRYGKHTLHLGGSHLIEVRGRGRRGDPTVREETCPYGRGRRKQLGLPLFRPASRNTET
jgi:DNA polymerase-4/DNA polymerase V